MLTIASVGQAVEVENLVWEPLLRQQERMGMWRKHTDTHEPPSEEDPKNNMPCWGTGILKRKALLEETEKDACILCRSLRAHLWANKKREGNGMFLGSIFSHWSWGWQNWYPSAHELQPHLSGQIQALSALLPLSCGNSMLSPVLTPRGGYQYFIPFSSPVTNSLQCNLLGCLYWETVGQLCSSSQNRLARFLLFSSSQSLDLLVICFLCKYFHV